MDGFDLLPVTAADTEHQAVLTRLAPMYCYEWSQYTGMDTDERGVYAFEAYLPLYWQRPDRKAFLLRCTRDPARPQWAGFALIDRDFVLHPDYDYSLGEFFVMHKYRRLGAGRMMAQALFDQYPGRWELGRNPKNLASVAFWDRVVEAYTGGRFERVLACPQHRYPDGTLGDILSFDSRR